MTRRSWTRPALGRSGKPDLRRMRAAAVSIVPTSTGASRAVGEVLPELAGRLDGIALRVPVPDGSIVDLVAILDRDTTIDEVNEAFDDGRCTTRATAACSSTPTSHSCPTTSSATPHRACSPPATPWPTGRMVKVLGWYDNEWGYANRLVDLVELMANAERSR